MHSSIPKLPSSNILSTDNVTTNVHNIGNGNILNHLVHRENVCQRRNVARVAAVVGEVRARSIPIIGSIECFRGRVLTSHVGKPVGHVGGLPLPPEAVEIGMVKEKYGVARRQDRVLHLYVMLVC